MSTVLSGIRVVELTEALAGPYAAMLLGDLGADVIKVERPGVGDHSRTWGPPFVGTESAYFLAANRNKRSLTLNYDHPTGAEILHRLLANADVFLCNQPSMESLQRRGIDPASLRSGYPRLIHCSITGYGFTGPKMERPGYDIIAQAEAGVMSFTGDPEGNPIRFPVAIADMTTGMYATMGILAALFARERTGHGDFLDMALFDSQLTWLANIGSNYLNAGVSPERWGNAHPSIVPYQLFRCADARHIVVAIGTQEQWSSLLPLLDAESELRADPRFADNSARIVHRQHLIPLLQARFARLPAEDWLAPGWPLPISPRQPSRPSPKPCMIHKPLRATWLWKSSTPRWIPSAASPIPSISLRNPSSTACHRPSSANIPPKSFWNFTIPARKWKPRCIPPAANQ